jgi:hypothetical protein
VGQLLRSSDLLLLERHDHNVEVLVKLDDLVEVFLLHLAASTTHLAGVLREKNLVDHNVVNVDVELG